MAADARLAAVGDVEELRHANRADVAATNLERLVQAEKS
jgi:hypothetical protein